MRKRLHLLLALAGALAGLVLIILWSHTEPPKRDIPYVDPVPAEIEAPPVRGAEERAEVGHGTLRGKVVDGRDQSPLPGARVEALMSYTTVEHDEEREADLPFWGRLRRHSAVTTDPEGTFALTDLPPNYWNLWVEKDGFAWTTVPRAKFDRTHTIELWPACSVRGKVVYPDDTPAAGVRIEYTPQGTNSEVFGRYEMKGLKAHYTKTRADGTFEYRDLPPGPFTVEVYPQDYLPAPWIYEPPLKPGEDRDLGVKKLEGGFTMKVHVKWRGTDRGVPGVEVKAIPIGDPMPRTKTGQTRRTDADGTARFQGLGGQTITKPRFLVAANVEGVGPVQPDEPGLLEPGSDVTIWLRKDGILKGRVEGDDGKPADAFFVRLEAEGHIARQLQVRSEADGSFKVYGVPEGRYRLHVLHPELIDASMPVEVAGGEERDIGTITLRRGAEIYGTVRRSGGAPLEGVVSVWLGQVVPGETHPRTVAHVSARSDGVYRMPGIAAGSYLLWPESVQDPSAVTKPVPVEIGPTTGAIQQDLVIQGEGFLQIRFMDIVEEGGAPRHVVQPVTWLRDTATGEEIRWFGEGTRLASGRYEVFVELPDDQGGSKRYSAATVQVQEGETTGPIEVLLFEIRHG